MIWTQNHGQAPGGTLVASDVKISGLSWDLYTSNPRQRLHRVRAERRPRVSARYKLDLTAFFDYLIQGGHVSSTSTLSQIGYGIEVVSTGGGTVRYNVTNFQVSPTHPAIEG